MLINDSKQIFCMDGTVAVKDTVHDWAATVEGAPGFATLMGVQAPVVTFPIANLLSAADSEFETGIGDWIGYWASCALSSSTDWASVGTHSMKVEPITATLACLGVAPVTHAGQSLKLTCDFKGTAGKTYNLAVWDEVNGAQTGTPVVATGNLQTLSVEWQYGAYCTTRQIFFNSDDATAPAEIAYVDNVILAGGTGLSWPTTALGLEPGNPYTIVCVVNKTTAWDDGLFHLMFMSVSPGPTQNGFEVMAAGPYGYICILNFHDGNSQMKGMLIDSTNWAANVDHIIVATIDENNVQRIFVDGVEGMFSSGTCGRESSFGTDTYIGIHNEGLLHPISGAILSTIYGRVFTDAEIALVSNLTLWTDLIDPPKPPTHKAEKKSAYVSILDPTGATPLARLTEHFPTTGWTPDIFENLSFESVNRGGYTVASFSIHRPVTQFWADLQYRNQVVIGRGSEIYWEGYIDKPIRSIRPDVIEVNCLGWSAELNQLWTALDITAPVGGYKMSTFINAVLLADPYTHLVAGMIETGDYAYPEGTVFAFAPNKYYSDALEELDAGNNFNWGVWGNRAIDLRAKHSSVDWLVWTGDCEDLTISPNPDGLCNYVMANFTQDGTHDEQVIVQDAGVGSSQEKYGTVIMQRVDIPGKVDEDSGGAGIPGGATHIAEVYLAEHKDLKVAAEFTCNRIFDAYGAEQYLGKVRGGEVVRIVDWLPTEETLGGVNDIATFEIKSPKYDHDNDTLAITPTEFLPSTDIQIARLQATGY